ncbi:MAG: hypothetical protein ACM3YF_02020, partial [Candidatus Zixiibacteriota bacterium]
DSDLDLATAGQGSKTVSVLRNLTRTENCPSRPGDLNADGQLTFADLILLLNCTFHRKGVCPGCVVDLTCDGTLSPGDVAALLTAIFLGQQPGC